MRKVVAIVCTSLILLGTVGCGGSDPARKEGFKAENINPNNVKMGFDSKKMAKPGMVKGAARK